MVKHTSDIFECWGNKLYRRYFSVSADSNF